MHVLRLVRLAKSSTAGSTKGFFFTKHRLGQICTALVCEMVPSSMIKAIILNTTAKKNILEMCACVLFAGLQGGANLWAGDIPFAPAVLEDLDK
jgi:hypothetical protein